MSIQIVSRIAATAAGLVCAGAVAAPSAFPAGMKQCGSVKVQSASYRVEVNGAVTCAFARAWTGKLAPLKGNVGSDGVLRIAKHPTGYTCSGTPFNEDSFPYQDQGGCRWLKGGARSFEWNLKI